MNKILLIKKSTSAYALLNGAIIIALLLKLLQQGKIRRLAVALLFSCFISYCRPMMFIIN